VSEISFQDQGAVAHCFGCGPDNPKGLQLKSFGEGEEAVALFEPQPYHCGGSPDIIYGGLIASLIDCHACNLAIAHLYRGENRPIGSEPRINCLTAQLNISLERPTPIDETLHLRARIKSVDRRKIWVACEVTAGGEVTAQGEVLAIRLRNGAPG
jgi:acyl-coenzyme A thioesterase PaaI-like protein